jgi:hypothetical protein
MQVAIKTKRRKKGKGDGKTDKKETKANVIIPSSVIQRTLQCLGPMPVEY